MRRFAFWAAGAIIALHCVPCAAQKFDYDLDFQYVFQNMEFDYSSNLQDVSKTINLFRVNPYLGVRFDSEPGRLHRVMVGVQLDKDLGTGGDSGIFNNLLAYYNFDGQYDDGRFTAAAGIFPRHLVRGMYSETMYDDEYLIFNNYVQGMLFNWESENLFAELGLDWKGMYGDDNHPDRRERFQIFSAGDWNFAGKFHFGWSASFYHYACCPLYDNVIDNHLLNPYFKWAPDSWFQNLSVSLEGVFTYQSDRGSGEGVKSPMALLSVQNLEKWNVGIYNTLFWGQDIMPFYDRSYSKGSPAYAGSLYFGEQNFHTMLDRPSFADVLAIYYSPRIKDWLRVNIALTFSLGEGSEKLPVFRGWQQHASLVFNLDRLVRGKRN